MKEKNSPNLTNMYTGNNPRNKPLLLVRIKRYRFRPFDTLESHPLKIKPADNSPTASFDYHDVIQTLAFDLNNRLKYKFQWSELMITFIQSLYTIISVKQLKLLRGGVNVTYTVGEIENCSRDSDLYLIEAITKSILSRSPG